jgi:hypothetical protein
MPNWLPMFALPNIEVRESIEVEGFALVSRRMSGCNALPEDIGVLEVICVALRRSLAILFNRASLSGVTTCQTHSDQLVRFQRSETRLRCRSFPTPGR